VRHTFYAMRLGSARGWIEFRNSLRNPQDITFYVIVGALTLTFLVWNRNEPYADTDLLLPAVVLPGILGALVVLGAYIGPMYSLAAEREDGTLLRVKAVPRGMTGYVCGQVLFQSASVVPMFAIIILPSLVLFDAVSHRGALSWLTVAGVTLLGLLAVLPIGIIVGSLIKGPNRVGTWGMLPIMALLTTSGIFYPIQELWGWVQAVVQVFPMYWLGLGMRSALLPPEAVALEVGASWRTLEMMLVLGAWAVTGLLAAPYVLRRVARKQAGSEVQARREAALQRIS
jgi:ABC-2 type transport system permease protein